MNIQEQKLTHWVDKKFKNAVLEGKGKILGEDGRRKSDFQIKPRGFWVSVNNSWEDWLKGNWDSWIEGKVCLNVELAKDINLFVIKTKQQFLNKYKELVGKNLLDLGIIEKFDMNIFHEELKKNYDGMILLSKPLWKHRLDGDFMYFYGWDCESICVWNKDKIKFNKIK